MPIYKSNPNNVFNKLDFPEDIFPMIAFLQILSFDIIFYYKFIYFNFVKYVSNDNFLNSSYFV